MYLWIFEAALIVFLIFAVISQLLIPAVRGTAVFPWFRRERRLRDRIVDANQALRDEELEAVLRARRTDQNESDLKDEQ